MTTNALLIPGDAPPSIAFLKRQLLFFDRVSVPTNDDVAILNDREITETFPNGRIVYGGATCPYPRVAWYDDQFRLVRATAERATRTGKLQFVSLAARSPVEATKNVVASVTALKIEPVLRASLPDYTPDLAPTSLPAAAWYNFSVLSADPFESQYMWMTRMDAEAPLPIGEEWRRVAIGRLGRTLKIIRRASSDNSIPLAGDPITQSICLALGAQAYETPPTAQQLSSAVIALDAVDPIALDAALQDMSWEEVFRLRKETLPSVSKLRGILAASVKAAGRPQNSDIQPYLAALKEVKDSHRRARDEVQETWKKIGIRTVETSAAASIPGGLSSIATNPNWAHVLAAAAFLVVQKAVSGSIPDIRAIMRAGKAQKASPLFAFDALVARGQDGLKKSARL